MRSCTRQLVLAIAALLAIPTASHAAPRAVVELFTSPNCSSCPPADALFVQLARSPELITLVMPIDDWSRAARKDQLAVRAFSERQMAYADARHENFIYTPQAMVNGALPADGADPAEIGNAIAQSTGVLSVPVRAVPAGNDIVVSVGGATGGSTSGTITVLPFVTSRTVRVYGEKLTYANLVRDVVRIGSWSGQPVRQAIPLQDYARYDGVVVLLQAGTAERPGPILGAARILLHAQT